MIESTAYDYPLMIAAMMAAVYLTRAGGYWLIGRLVIGPRLRKMLDALPGAIITATVAPGLINGGLAAAAAVAAALIAMIVTRRDVIAIFAGMAATAAVRIAGF